MASSASTGKYDASPRRCRSCLLVSSMIFTALLAYYMHLVISLNTESTRIAGRQCPRADDEPLLSMSASVKSFFSAHSEIDNVYPWVLTMVGALRAGGNTLRLDDQLHIADHDIDIAIAGHKLSKRRAVEIIEDFVRELQSTKRYLYVWFFPYGVQDLGNNPTIIAMEKNGISQTGWLQAVSEVRIILQHKLWPRLMAYLGCPQWAQFTGLESLFRALWFPVGVIAAPIWARLTIIDFHVYPGRYLAAEPAERVLWAGQEWSFPKNGGEAFLRHAQTYYMAWARPITISLCDFATPEGLWPEDIELANSPFAKDALDACANELRAQGYKTLDYCRTPRPHNQTA